MTTLHRFRWPLLLALALAPAGCGILDVSNPGPIEDEKLDSPESAAALVYGMSHDLSSSLNLLVEMAAVVSDELTFSGSFGNFGGINGVVEPDDMNSTWRRAQRARWVAENGVERLKNSLGDEYETSANAARANLLAGISGRFMGENFCQAVIDGGPAQDRSVYFERAEGYFTEAARLADAAGVPAYKTAALGGRAEVRAALGRWSEAAVDAQAVTTGFSYDAYYSGDNSSQLNAIADETQTTYQFTVYGNRWAEHHGDPRAPWDTLYASGGTIAKSANGNTPVFQQNKYVSLGAPIPLVTGVAMRTLQAEAALRANDMDGMTGHLNDARAHYGMAALGVPANATDAWSVLRYERGATTWLEGRRLWDLSRWYAETGPAHDDFMANRSKCLPVSEDEMQTNPNFP